MVLLKAKNPEISDLERTQLSAAVAASGTSLTVDASEGFAVNDWIVVGEVGTEVAEAVRVTAVTNSTTLAVTAVTFAHVIDEPVVKTLYDQVRFYSNRSEE